MIRVVDISTWRARKPRNKEQLKLLDHLDFMRIKSHYDLFVVDVTDEEMTILILMGITEAKDINTNYTSAFNLIGSHKFLHKTENGYVIVHVNGDMHSACQW